ncbi:hypothetical protein AVEN_169651-1, partial [Araneus ventricosus]
MKEKKTDLIGSFSLAGPEWILCVSPGLTWTKATMEQVREGEPSPLPSEYIETIEIPDDEPTRCQQLR